MAKCRPGYANFALTDPPLKLVLLEGEAGGETRMDHLGVEVESSEIVHAAADRLAAAELTTRAEEQATCCAPSAKATCCAPRPNSPSACGCR